MARSLRQIKNRIRSIQNTQKVTSAMEMISIAKLNRLDKMLYSMRPYFSKMDQAFKNLLANTTGISHSFLEARPLEKGIALCLFTSDSGLCGVYNNSIIRAAEAFIKQRGVNRIKLISVGKKGFNYFKGRGVQVINSYFGASGRYSDKLTEAIVNYLTDIFLKHKVNEVYVGYMRFGTTLIHQPVFEKFLELEAGRGQQDGYIFEPNASRVLEELLPKYIFTKMKLVLLEAFTSEHAARIVAMKMATDNAKELLESLTLLRNKVRQASITQEIMEIISATEALKG